MEECSSAGGQCHHAVAKSERAVFLVSNALGRLSKDCAQRENEGVRGRRVSCMCRRSYVAYLLAVANSSLSPQLKNMESPLTRLMLDDTHLSRRSEVQQRWIRLCLPPKSLHTKNHAHSLPQESFLFQSQRGVGLTHSRRELRLLRLLLLRSVG